MPFARGASPVISRCIIAGLWILLPMRDGCGSCILPLIFEDHVYYFPRAEDEAVRHFAIPFLKLMFAHANFEGVFRDLQNVVAEDETFSANRKTAGSRKIGQKRCCS
jgi:hypothetical protein